MKLQNTFTVPVSVDEAWRTLLDVEQIAPCMPGATVERLDGDDVVGRVKVKLGPISLTYRGMVTFVEKDEKGHRVVMSAAAREARGSGTASATITTVLHPNGDGTEVAVDTDLNITGKPAQFGRGVMEDVSGNLVRQFASSLAQELDSGDLGSAGGREQRVDVGPPVADFAGGAHSRPSADAVDLLGAAGGPLAQRGGGALAVALAFAVGWFVGRRTR